jgi:hypothetical protein
VRGRGCGGGPARGVRPIKVLGNSSIGQQHGRVDRLILSSTVSGSCRGSVGVLLPLSGPCRSTCALPRQDHDVVPLPVGLCHGSLIGKAGQRPGHDLLDHARGE